MTTTTAARSLADLRTDQALPAHVVHKAAPEQVFVTDWMSGPGEDWCTIAARLPLAHARFSDTAAPYHDILLIAEAVRQAGLVVAGEILKVEDDRQFLLREMKIELDPLAHASKSRDTCELLVSQDPSSDVKMRPGRSMAGGTMRARLTIGGRPAGICEVIGVWVPDEFYDRLRGANRDASSGTALSAPPQNSKLEHRTGKLSHANSALSQLRDSESAGEYEASLVIDTDDPTFFDHPLDHVPGLYLLAGIQQVAIAGACRHLGVEHSHVVVSALQMKFARIAEFQPDVICAVTLEQDGCAGNVSCSQDGKVCCEGSVHLTYV